MHTSWFFSLDLLRDGLAGLGAAVLLCLLSLAVKRAAITARQTLAELQALGDLDGEENEC